MSSAAQLRSRWLVTLIAGMTAGPLIALLWLGFKLLEQDRALERQQVQQRVDRAADLLAAKLQDEIAALEQRSAASVDWPDGAVQLTFGDGRLDVFPPRRLAYLPVAPALPEPPRSRFAAAEALEFSGDLKAAAALYGQMAAAPDPATRAGAQVRLARTFRSAGRLSDAAAAYSRIQDADDVAVDGVPVALLAAYGRGTLLETQRHSDELRRLGSALRRDLQEGRWLLDEPTYSLYLADAVRWSGDPSWNRPPPAVLAVATSVLWERWRATPRAAYPLVTPELLDVNGHFVAVVPRSAGSVLRVLLAADTLVRARWLPPAAALAHAHDVTFELRSARGTPVFGRIDATSSVRTSRAGVDVRLPWQLVVGSVTPPPEARAFAVRRRLVLTGLVLIGMLAGAASYLILRAVGRELALARLQSDFVAAVSHEFRTPLTALRQFTEMLRGNPHLADDRRRLAYDVQARATERLTRLVESLLDFGRMEAGARPYHFTTRDAAALVRDVIEDVRADARATGHQIALLEGGSAPVAVDDEALGRAVRNLLDNAVKYSPAGSTIDVGIERQNGHAAIFVRDHGIGIPAHERTAIFGKFQRGEQARTLGIGGTGIGLAMVDEIVRAHGGRTEIESEPGRGSTFRIVLPVAGT